MTAGEMSGAEPVAAVAAGQPPADAGPDFDASSTAPPVLAPAFYARQGGGWHDYWALLHPPYTVWHLSYVLLGASLAQSPDPRIVAGALVAFGLAVGVGSHAFDELHDRPLRTRIPSFVLAGLGMGALAVAVALGLAAAATAVGPAFVVYVVLGAALVLLYGFEVRPVHTDLGFALGWGAFPVAATACATGANPVPAAIAALAATLLSIAQRRLSTRARAIRRRADRVSGEVLYLDGRREPIDAGALIGAPEAALSILWLALPLAALAMLLTRWF
jgi:hypothetical protein